MEFDLHTPKVIGDPIHGYIGITELEYDLLQLPTINRLHYVRQTAAAHLVFPGSVTTRFSHIVGALGVGGDIIQTVLNRLKKEDFDKLFPHIESPEFLIKAVRLACLLHDVGHGPFSHSGEAAMLHVLQKYHRGEIDEAKRLFNESDETKIPIHEYYTYKLITNGEISEEIISHEDYNLRDFVADLIVKIKTSQIAIENKDGYNILVKIVSSQLDADRMDYLLRDSMMSGVQFGQVDIDRIIQNIAIVKNKKGVYQLAFHERVLGSIEEMLDARFKMYKYFYNHHTVVGINRLLYYATNNIVNECQDIAKLFHWKSFDSGSSTDMHIMNLLLERKNDIRFLKTKGLIDRRFLPISIFKSTPDFGRFVKKINELTGINNTKESMNEKIALFFQNQKNITMIKNELEEKKHLQKCDIFQSTVTVKPYSHFTSGDQIYLFRKIHEELCEFTSESTYFEKINEEWSKYKDLYIFYHIVGQQKKQFSSLKEEVTDILALTIADSIKNE